MSGHRASDSQRSGTSTDLARLSGADHRRNIPSVELDEALNPHRSEEQLRAQQHVAELLAHRGVLLAGKETGMELADLWSAVDQFESVVEARGGDTMTNAPRLPRAGHPRLCSARTKGGGIGRGLHPPDPASRGGIDQVRALKAHSLVPSFRCNLASRR